MSSHPNQSGSPTGCALALGRADPAAAERGQVRPARGKPLDLATLGSPALSPPASGSSTRSSTCARPARPVGPDAERRTPLAAPPPPSASALPERPGAPERAPAHRCHRARRPDLHRRPLRRPRLRDALPRRQAPRDRTGRRRLLALRLVRPATRSRRTGSPATSPSPASVPSPACGAKPSSRSARPSATACWSTSGPTMYAAFWRPPADLAPQVATVRVLHEHNGAQGRVSHFNKATKGRIVRAVLEHGGARAPRTASPTCWSSSAGTSRFTLRRRRAPSSTWSSREL
jgi:hypothetical protein